MKTTTTAQAEISSYNYNTADECVKAAIELSKSQGGEMVTVYSESVQVPWALSEKGVRVEGDIYAGKGWSVTVSYNGND